MTNVSNSIIMVFMINVGTHIRDARERASMTQQELATCCGVSRAAVAQWENGSTKPSLKHLQQAADSLGVWVSWITGEGEYSGLEDEAVPFRPRGFNVPVIDYISAGSWGEITDAYPPGRGMDSLVSEQPTGPSAFALEVRGNSMETEFKEGDKIIVDPDTPPQPGDLVVAKLDDQEEATFKKYRPRGTDDDSQPVIDLVPLNEDWPTLHIDKDHPGSIIGTVIEHRRYCRA